MEFATHDIEHVFNKAWGTGCGDTEEARVGVGVVECYAGFNPAVLVEDVGIEAGIHTLTGSTSRERTPTTKESLEGSEGVNVGGGDGKGFEGKMDVA